MNLVEAGSRRILGIYLLLGILAATGAYEITRLPSAIFPSVTFPLIRVIAEVGEEPAARMMPTVTRPLEEAILRVPGIQDVISTTARGSSEITARFAWGTDMQVALQRVQAETQRVRPNLPSETRIDVEWMNPAIFPIEGYALISNTMTLAQLRDLAEYTLKPALIRIRGVSQIQIQGGLLREFELHLDRAAIEGRKLAVSDVVNAITANDVVISAGLTERNHELYLTLVNGRVHSLGALDSLVVPVPNRPPARLGQLGTVDVANEISFIRTTADGHYAVLVNIVRQPSANTVAIADAVDRLLKTRPDLIPRGVRWINFYDQARFVSDSVGGTRDAIVIGVLLAALVLFVFLRKWRLTLIAVVAIPVTVAIVGFWLSLLHQTINLMTLAGIAAALGLIADDAIVVIEDIERRERKPETEPEAFAELHPAESEVVLWPTGPEEAAGAGDVGAPGAPAPKVEPPEHPAETTVRELRPALIGSSLSTILILLPFALLTGVVGAFFKPLALTMALTLMVSFLVAVIAVPATVHRFVPEGSQAQKKKAGKKPGPWARARRFMADYGGHAVARGWHALARRGAALYDRVVDLFVGHGWLAVAMVAGLIAVAYLLYRTIGTDFLPRMDEGSIIMDYFTPPGTSLSETDQMLRHVEEVIMSNPAVQSYSRRTGTQLGFFITEPNTGDYVIKLKPKGQRPPIDRVIDEIRTRVAAVEPAVNTDFGQILEDDIGDLTGGTPQPIDVKVFGHDQAVLERKARRIAEVLSGISGVTDIFNGITIAGPALNVQIKPEAAALFGLTTQAIHAAVEPAVNGSVVSQVRVGEKMYDLRVFAPPMDTLAGLKLRAAAPPAQLVPLFVVADVTTGPPEVEVDRENLRTFFGVTARLSGRDLGSAMAEVKSKLAAQVPLGPGQSIEYGGLYQQQQQSFRGLLYVLIAGLVLVGVIMLFEFADWRAPVVVAFCALAVLAGVFGALILTGQTLNISSYVGAIMMVGIVGENAVFVIHEARLALQAGAETGVAWSHAAHLRGRPVAMTILATAFALSPLALAIGRGSALIQPLAIAVIGGFVLSGPIVLLALPGLYRLLDPRGRLGRPWLHGAGAHEGE